MEGIQTIRSKIERKKEEKQTSLIDAAYALFVEKGVASTSIQNIVNRAGVAKGTFYLYFKSKEDIRDKIIRTKTRDIIIQAIEEAHTHPELTFEQTIIRVIDNILNYFVGNPELIQFINRDLSLSFYSEELSRIFSEDMYLYDLFDQGLKSINPDRSDTDVIFFMVVELVSSSAYFTIIEKKPCDIETFKPYLYEEIKHILHTYRKRP
ncbi:MAG: TetR/AcrR family transcriptional regulator [Erysipelotrichaceae bacterium]|nr:TetR/AcrR family transcriptional regulator [Erysipelotrichaceae bacterium]